MPIFHVLIFFTETGKDTVNQTLIDIDRPSPYYLYKALQQTHVALSDPWGKSVQYSPYVRLDFTQVHML